MSVLTFADDYAHLGAKRRRAQQNKNKAQTSQTCKRSLRVYGIGQNKRKHRRARSRVNTQRTGAAG